jgi:hypothetical protein
MTRRTFTADPSTIGPDLYTARVHGADIEGLRDSVTVRVGHAFTDIWLTVEDGVSRASTSGVLSADAARRLAEVLLTAADVAESRDV